MRSTYLALVLSFGAATVGCDVPYEVDPNFGSDSSIAETSTDAPADTAVDTAPPGDGACASNLDCAGKLDTPLCNPTNGKCVACLTSDRCAKGQYCNKDNECVPGCRDDADCTSPPKGDAGVGDAKSDSADANLSVLRCDLESHMCRGCKTDTECPDGYLCSVSDSLCKPGCNATKACATGRDCCEGQCFDTTATSLHCGGCGKACVAPPHTVMKCDASTCKVDTCEAGWANCNGMDADGCETDIFTKSETCGGCGTACTFPNGAGLCEMGKCKVTTCSTGFGDCDKNAANGCEQPLNTNDHCGVCDTKCAPTNATGTCATGTCLVSTCNSGFGDCDLAPGNGCEVNLKTNATHCNTCGNVCPSTSGTPACVAGACKFSTCSAGLGDCDGSGACATPITGDINNCGACGRTCAVANGTPACAGTTCSVASCAAGFSDCNSSYVDGCERSLRTVTDCGACGVPCSRANATPTCTTGSCSIGVCNANFGNCDMIDSNGCEENLQNNAAHCGACNKACTVTNGTGACSGTSCTVASCTSGYANCDGVADACERNLAAPSNTCPTAQAINDSGGSPDFFGCRTTETGSVTTTSSKFFKVRLTDCGGAGCRASDPLRARFVLTNPTDVDYDLFVYAASACTAPVGTGGTTVGVGGTETVTYSHPSCPATLDLWVEVRYKSGSGASCAAASLAVTSAF